MGFGDLLSIAGAVIGTAMGHPELGAALGSAAGSLFGGDSSGGSYGGTQTVVNAPALMTPEQERLFDDWFTMLYGSGGGETTGGSEGSQGTTSSSTGSMARLADNPDVKVPMKADHVYVRNLNPHSPYYGEVIDMGPVRTKNYPPSAEQVNTSNVEEIGNALAYGGNVPGLVTQGKWDLPERLNPVLTARGNFQLLGTGKDLGVSEGKSSGGGGSESDNNETLLQRLLKDFEEKKGAEEKFLEKYGEISTPYREYLQEFVNYGQPTPMAIKFGDTVIPFVSGSQRYQQQMGMEAENALLKNSLGEAGLERDIGTTYTSESPYLSYFRDWLNPLYQAEQQRRYGIPSTTSSADVSMPEESMLNKVANWVQLGTQIGNLYDTWKKQQNTGYSNLQPFMG